MKYILVLTVVLMSAICGPSSVESFAEVEQPVSEDVRPWILSPQICRGKPWSSTAKEPGWKVLAGSGVCRATANDSSMIASMRPMEGGRFVVTVALQMQKGAMMQLFLDEITLGVSDDGQTICVVGGPEFLRFHVERPNGQRWSELHIDRKQKTFIVTLNGKEVIRFDDGGRSYSRIGLKPIGGATDVNRFSLTGQLVRQKQK